MRNLKKVLALVLALVMSLSLVTIANATDFSDDADIDYEEAVDVMSAIGVIDGVGNNSFDPDGTLTREQAAKLITFMLMGSNAEKLGVENTSFKDVAATRWSAAAIEYCATMGIIDGAGDGNFYPAGKLTGYAFAKMLLTALGYDSKIEGFTGPSWTINVATMGMQAGLHNGMENIFGSAELSRQEAAQMALNAIKAPLVQYTNGTTVTVGGQEVSVGSSRWEYVTTTIARQQNISDRRLTNTGLNTQNSGYTVEFGEKYFPNLRLIPETDDFERPSHTWVFENKELGTYVDYDLLVETYTKAVTYKELYELLGRSNLENYTFEYYVDGILYTSAPPSDPLTTKFMTAAKVLSRTTNNAGLTGRGVLTQVFVDHDFDEGTGLIKITSIRTWLGQVTTAYNDNREQASVNVFTSYITPALPALPYTHKMPKTVAAIDVPNAVDLEADEYVLVNMSGKDTRHDDPQSYSSSNNWDIVKVSDPTIITDTAVTAFSKGSDTEWNSETIRAIFKSVTADGTKYDNSATAAFNEDVLDRYNQTLLSDRTYDIYLDQYGYAIGIDLHSGTDNYVFITGFDMGESAISKSNADAGAIFMDGTMKTINVNVKDTNKNIRNATDPSNNPNGTAYFAEWDSQANYTSLPSRARVNRWFTYTEKDGVYTLTPATRMMTTDASAGIYLTAGAPREKIKCNNVVLDRTLGNTNEKFNPLDPNPAFHPTTTDNVRVYGNDDSVYLVAGMGATDGGRAITSVEGVYTGVQNVEIDLFTANGANTAPVEVNGAGLIIDNTVSPAAPSILYDNTYTVFDKNNYIIASVVLGEVVGGNANYVYALTAAKNERIENGKYYWEFDAVVDGQIKTLTVEDKFNNTIDDLRPGHIQEVRYSGDYVVAIKTIADSKIYVNPTEQINVDNHAVYDIGHVTNTSGLIKYRPGRVATTRTPWDCGVAAQAGHGGTNYGTLNADGTSAIGGYADQRLDVQDLKLVGRTLYLDVTKDFGLVMASKSTPTILIQDEKGEEDVQTYYDDISGAIAALEDLVPDVPGTPSTIGKGFRGRITAVLDGQGRAKWVVITSDTIVPYRTGGSVSPTVAFNSVVTGPGVATVNFTGGEARFELQVIDDGKYVPVGTFNTTAGTVNVPTSTGKHYRIMYNGVVPVGGYFVGA